MQYLRKIYLVDDGKNSIWEPVSAVLSELGIWHMEKSMEEGLPLSGTEGVLKIVRGAHCLSEGEKGLQWIGASEGTDMKLLPYAFLEPEDLTAEYLEQVYRRLAGKPWDILETERCLIRETTEEDVDSFYSLYEDPEVLRFMEPLFPKREDEILYTKNYRENVYGFFGYGIWTVLDRESGEVIGRAGLVPAQDAGGTELGYVIRKEYRRKGIATEVCKSILTYGFEELELESVFCMTLPENTGAVSLCERLGMRYAGLHEGAELDFSENPAGEPNRKIWKKYVISI